MMAIRPRSETAPWVALVVDSTDLVDRIYHKAIELGGTCEGPAGLRMEGFYAAYFRDLDGNKLGVINHSGYFFLR